ncbi:MAG TPA: hypothetical protein VFW83_10475, partial [Bryobacteraceae bacterium]|nr:hypothetical protein [Bryobacteraceae bacterium]
MHKTTPVSRNRSEFLRDTVRRSARAIERAFRQAAALENDSSAAAQNSGAVWLLENESYVRSQFKDAAQSLSKRYCHGLAKFPDADGTRAAASPRIYRIVSEAMLHVSGPLTVCSLAGRFQPKCLGLSLTLAELWAIPSVVKLVLLEELAKAVQDGPFDAPSCEAAIAGAIQRLRWTDRIRWRDLVEAVSEVERILRTDPSGVYPKMTYESRDLYRKTVEGIATETDSDEVEVARIAIALARECLGRNEDARTAHVGYYLIGPGIRRLERRGQFSVRWKARLRRRVLGMPDAVYIGGTLAVTVFLALALWRFLGPFPWWWVALLAIPLTQTATALVNLAVNLKLGPCRLPRMDFSKGIPPEYRTCVAVPTLLLSRAGVAKLLRQLEIHYLANRDRNLR